MALTLNSVEENNTNLINIDAIYQLVQTQPPVEVRESYKKFLKKSLIDFFLKTEFNGLYGYHYGDSQEDDSYKGYNITCCKIQEDKINSYLDAFKQKFLAFPLFWKDYLCMFYIALKQYSQIQDNARIICLGESPMKIVFIQEFFLKNEYIKQRLAANSFAINSTFNYFSLSRLQTGIAYLYPRIKDHYTEINALFIKGNMNEVNAKINDLFIKNNQATLLSYFSDGGKETYKSALNKIENHFKKSNLNPRFILTENKPIYFEDRCESYASVLGLIYVYIQLCNREKFTKEERQQFYTLFYIIGFDNKDEEEPSFAIDECKKYVINYLMYYLFSSSVPGEEDGSLQSISTIEPHFKQINYFNPQRYKKTETEDDTANFLAEIEKDLFFTQKDTLLKNINFLSVPEFGINATRCIQGVNLYGQGLNTYDEMAYTEVVNMKQQGDTSINCNIFNFFIIYYLNLLTTGSNTILEDLIIHVKNNTINEEEVFNNTSYKQDIFGTDEKADQWWKGLQEQMNTEYKLRLEEYRERIINNIERDSGNNYFKNLLKTVEIQRMIGTIRLASLDYKQDIIDALINKKATNMPLNYMKVFDYNASYKKMWKPTSGGKTYKKRQSRHKKTYKKRQSRQSRQSRHKKTQKKPRKIRNK